MSKVLITGAGGFIGSHLTEELVSKGHTVRAMVHYNGAGSWGWLDSVSPDIQSELEIVSMDIRDAFAVNSAVKGCDKVFHLASLIAIPFSYLAPASYVETNVTGTLNVLEACKAHNVERLVHTSTSETYGTAQYTPIDEKHPMVGQSPYSATKIAADKLVESYHLSFELPVATIRPFNTFGPRQSARAVIPTVIAQALSGTDVIQLGALDPIRDMNFVADTVAGFCAVADSDACVGRVMNCGRGSGVSIGDLAQEILSICDSTAEITEDPQRIRPSASEVMELVCDNAAIKTATGWKPQVSLRAGLELTVEWLQNNTHLYKSDIYNI